MRTLSWLNIFEPILDRIIPKSGRKKENAKSQPDQWKSGMNKIEEEKIRKVYIFGPKYAISPGVYDNPSESGTIHALARSEIFRSAVSI